MSPQSAPTAATPSPRAHRTRTLVLVAVAAALVTGLIALGLGGLGGALLTSGLSGSSSGSRADQNLSEGCAILDRVESELPLAEDSLDLDEPLLFELGAAGQLFWAAAAGKGGDEATRDAGSGLVSGASRQDVVQVNESLEALEPICTDA